MHTYAIKACSHIFGFHFISLPMNETERETERKLKKADGKLMILAEENLR